MHEKHGFVGMSEREQRWRPVILSTEIAFKIAIGQQPDMHENFEEASVKLHLFDARYPQLRTPQ